ncbi:uncharacterized protein METZ01_LOCUS114512 [marine metagenome]|uniref:Uncharacterized protein n=1 Tax=marine metagenome TaxID=408172 RepID=A0A381XAF8_9ZZZZ
MDPTKRALNNSCSNLVWTEPHLQVGSPSPTCQQSPLDAPPRRQR